jgi:hypothetical protein
VQPRDSGDGAQGVFVCKGHQRCVRYHARGDCRGDRGLLGDLNKVAPGLRLVPRFAAICNDVNHKS